MAATTKIKQMSYSFSPLSSEIAEHTIDLEAIVLGAVLTDYMVFERINNVFSNTQKPFSEKKHNIIWRAFLSINGRGEKIDYALLFGELLKFGSFEEVGGDYISELMTKSISTVNVELHAQKIYEIFIRRKYIAIANKLAMRANDYTYDVSEIFDDVFQDFNALERCNSPLVVNDMKQVMETAKNAKPQKMLCGSLLRERDLAVLFAGAGCGKSILAVQIADNISKGLPTFGILPNECEPKRVLYYDAELSFSDYQSRYLDGANNSFDFSENYFRLGENENSTANFADISKNAISLLLRQIEKIKPQILVVDNITAIANGATADADVAMNLMNNLKHLKLKYNLTILVLAHSPKRDLTKSLSTNDLAGSSQILNFATNVFCIGKSKQDSSIRYIKQVKIRNGEEVFHDENVLQLSVEKRGAFLGFFPLELPFGREVHHLETPTQEQVDEKMKQAFLLHQEGKSLRTIISQLGLSISHTILHCRLKKMEINE